MRKSILDNLAWGSFRLLSEAIREADLTETLRMGGPFTFFAPTDEAFEGFLRADPTNILADRRRLRSVLTYHLVPGRLSYSDVQQLPSLRTLHGQSLSIDLHPRTTINGARVVRADIECGNGIIHAIDSVLVPSRTLSGYPA